MLTRCDVRSNDTRKFITEKSGPYYLHWRHLVNTKTTTQSTDRQPIETGLYLLLTLNHSLSNLTVIHGNTTHSTLGDLRME